MVKYMSTASRTWRIEMASIQVELTKLDNLAEGVLCPSGSKGLDFVTLFLCFFLSI